VPYGALHVGGSVQSKGCAMEPTEATAAPAAGGVALSRDTLEIWVVGGEEGEEAGEEGERVRLKDMFSAEKEDSDSDLAIT